MFQNSHSILKVSVFRIITHLTISAETEEIRKLKMSFKIGKIMQRYLLLY